MGLLFCRDGFTSAIPGLSVIVIDGGRSVINPRSDSRFSLGERSRVTAGEASEKLAFRVPVVHTPYKKARASRFYLSFQYLHCSVDQDPLLPLQEDEALL